MVANKKVRKNILRLNTRSQWRKWLQQNFEKETEAWLAFPNQDSGEKKIPYNDAVEEALCFGWIDSVVNKLDSGLLIQRFTPRRNKSPYSQPNIERLRRQMAKNRVHQAVVDSAEAVLKKKFVFPKDVVAKIKEDKAAWKNYRKFSDTYKRIRIAYIDGARKRPEEFKKRLNNFLEKTRQNKLIAGHGGVGLYY